MRIRFIITPSILAAITIAGAIVGCAYPDPEGDDISSSGRTRTRNEETEDAGNASSSSSSSTEQTQSTTVDSGSPSSTGTDAGTAMPQGPLKAFVSSTLVTGNLGGAAGADTICNNAAKAAGIAGTFTAWISTTQTNAIDRITANGPWQLVDGTEVFKTKADLTKGTLAAAFRKDEKNATPPLVEDRVWTGTSATGTVTTNTCNNWGGTGGSGHVGEAEQTNGGWTALVDEACTEVNRVYCLQQ